MSPLTSALRAAADEVPTYDVVDAAVALGRRRRRRRALASVATGVAVLALVVVAAVPLLGQRVAMSAGQPSVGPALPDRIGPPGMFAAGVGHSPPGAASVIFTERSGIFTDDARVVVVGAADDTYRTLDTTRAAYARTALLSPDGGRIAYSTGRNITVTDLRTGKSRRFPSPDSGSDGVVPAVWLRDGSGLVVLSTNNAVDPASGIGTGLWIMGSNGGYSGLATNGAWRISSYGYTVAVSPNSTRFAFQYSDVITIYDVMTRKTSVITMPDRQTVLAGRGAWTPDGRSLAVVHRDTGDQTARRWELRMLDPDTGLERDPGHRPSLAPASVIRLLGWDDRTGDPVVAGIDADQTVTDFGSADGSFDALTVRRIGIYALGDQGSRTLLAPTDGITNLDVADALVIAGLTRPGHPPRSLPPIVVVPVAAAVLLLAGFVVWRRYWSASARDRRWPTA